MITIGNADQENELMESMDFGAATILFKPFKADYIEILKNMIRDDTLEAEKIISESNTVYIVLRKIAEKTNCIVN